MNTLLKGFARLLADEMADDAAVAAIENGFGHGAGPGGIHAVIEGVDIDAGFLAVIRERRLIFGQEAADEMDVGVVIEADAEDGEALRRVLARELGDHGKFVAAGLTPGGPKADEDGLAAIFGEGVLVAGQVDEGQVGRLGGFVGGGRGLARGGRVRGSDGWQKSRESGQSEQKESGKGKDWSGFRDEILHLGILSSQAGDGNLTVRGWRGMLVRAGALVI